MKLNEWSLSRQTSNEGGTHYMNKTWDWRPGYEKLRLDAVDADVLNVLKLIERSAEYAVSAATPGPTKEVGIYARAYTAKMGIEYLIEHRMNLSHLNLTSQVVGQMALNLEGRYSPKSICTYLSYLNQFFIHLLCEGEVTENPVQRRFFPAVHRPKMHIVKPDVCMLYAGELMDLGTHDGQTYGMAVALCGHTGLRTQELWGLKSGDYVPSDERLGPHFRLKGKCSQWRTVPLTQDCATLLEAYMAVFCLGPRTDFLFHEPQGGAYPLIFNRLYKATDAIWDSHQRKIPRFNVTGARRGFATYLFSRGMSVEKIQALYDHSNSRLTLRYIDREEAVQMAEVSQFSPMFLEQDGGLGALLGP